jgi:mono/diheme cytochrome c family protein
MTRALFAAGLMATTLATGAEAPQTPPPKGGAQVLYLSHCSGCHGADGMGDPRVDVPPFPGFLGAFLRDPEGRRYVANVGGVMSAGLNDADTALVLTWIMETFGASSLPPRASGRFDADEVRKLRETRPADAVALRRQIAQRLKQQGIHLPDYPWP